MKAVRFDKYGGIEVLHITEVARPVPGNGQVLVRVKTAGINPAESAIREGKFESRFHVIFPSGEGSDFAGIVEELGQGVKDIAVGDEVIGFTNNRSSHAEFVAADTAHIVRKPQGVPWQQAGALFIAGTTAYAAVKAVSLNTGDTVVVSGAAGGVGSIVVQLARNAGARVIGLASEANHKWLATHGIVPIAYGEGLLDRILTASGGKVDAFIDTYGNGYVELALKLNVSPGRIDTIIDFAAAAKYGARTDGSSQAATAGILSKLATMIAEGHLEIPVAKVYKMVDVRDAYRELEKHHTHGKIVLVP
ncbi:MAG: NADP-dependent oxidoreductase [Puia sp.]|nr:NADP-dependent oxidoreductase [Puia sp.]